MYCETVAQWQVKLCSVSESFRAHILLADRVLADRNISGYCFLLPSEFICGWISLDEGIHVWWDEGQIMEVINLIKNQPTKEFKILFIGIVYKATWKVIKKKAFILLHCLPTFLHLRRRPKVHCFCQWSAIRTRIWFFNMLLQYKLDQLF